MTFVLNLVNIGSEVEWSRTLMITWLVTVLALSAIEVFRLLLSPNATGTVSDSNVALGSAIQNVKTPAICT